MTTNGHGKEAISFTEEELKELRKRAKQEKLTVNQLIAKIVRDAIRKDPP